MDLSDVQAPTNNGTFDAQAAFQDAVARARQIAAKINQPGAGDAQCQGIKRPFDNDPFEEPEAKKPAALSDHKTGGGTNEAAADFMMQQAGNKHVDSINAQLRAMAEGGMNFQSSHAALASQAAQEAAARINQQLGVSSSLSPQPKPAMHAPAGFVTTEEYSIPNRMVGLVIGKGGEQITRLQTETDCKVQIAPDSGNMDERPCTLTGSPSAIMGAKNAIQKIIDKGKSATMMVDHNMIPDGQKLVEILVPGNKVGLVIGRGGETIKNLQEQARVKMVMIQDSNLPTMQDKPLRITGDPQLVDKAQQMVMELINSDNGPGGNMGGMFQANDYGMNDRGGHRFEMIVPRAVVGVIIGKNGEMIRKIQAESSAKVQFKPDDQMLPERVCAITGSPEKVQEASDMITELINKYNQDYQFQGGMGRGMGRGRGRGRGGPFMGGGPPGPGRGMGRGGPYNGGGGGSPNFPETTTYAVPADKCGLVIGKGGETIREINRTTGGHVELQRTPAPNPNQKIFTVRGTPQQIQHAFQLIGEKVGLQDSPGGPGGPPGGPSGPGPQGPGGPGGGGFDYGQPQQPPSPQGYGGQSGWQQNQYQNYQQYQGQQGTPGDPSKQAVDNAAAWAAYYAQYYSQYGQFGQQQQPSAAPQTPQPQQAPQSQQPAQQQQAGYPSPAINPQTGQPDYSAAWVEYYRQQGNHMQASLILQQAGQGGAPAQQAQLPQQ